ncbi:uncharacterized protein An01g02540 [Aspergillus niger]|uniref:Contig An01c0080, genomic contig n=2 Tax=Aspergillus niger TaxID=5061 RepID=A2Q800_ASPNC|nr:uncharacterized protein An01g02540 [Aspergillus niger]CAK43623.1 unnamed protein product [Aspergillus niger]
MGKSAGLDRIELRQWLTLVSCDERLDCPGSETFRLTNIRWKEIGRAQVAASFSCLACTEARAGGRRPLLMGFYSETSAWLNSVQHSARQGKVANTPGTMVLEQL